MDSDTPQTPSTDDDSKSGDNRRLHINGAEEQEEKVRLRFSMREEMGRRAPSSSSTYPYLYYQSERKRLSIPADLVRTNIFGFTLDENGEIEDYHKLGPRSHKMQRRYDKLARDIQAAFRSGDDDDIEWAYHASDNWDVFEQEYDKESLSDYDIEDLLRLINNGIIKGKHEEPEKMGKYDDIGRDIEYLSQDIEYVFHVGC